MDPSSSPSSSSTGSTKLLWQQIMAARNNLDWIADTFRSKDQVRNILAPAVDNHVMTNDDLDKAVAFLPTLKAAQKFNQSLLTAIVLTTPLTLFSIRRIPRARRYSPWIIGSSIASLCYCTHREIEITRGVGRFMQTLEDPEGFVRALRRARSAAAIATPQDEQPLDAWADDSASESPAHLPSRTTRPALEAASRKPSPKTPSRWEQLRAANAQPGARSSWDLIRERNAQARPPKPSSSRWGDSDSDGGGGGTVDDRAAEQAKFDAMLEEERQRASSGS